MGRISKNEAEALSKELLANDLAKIEKAEEYLGKFVGQLLRLKYADEHNIIKESNLGEWVNVNSSVQFGNQSLWERTRNNYYQHRTSVTLDNHMYLPKSFPRINEDNFDKFMTSADYENIISSIESILNDKQLYRNSLRSLEEYLYNSLRTHNRIITEFPQLEGHIEDGDLPMSKKQKQIQEIKKRINHSSK